VAATLLVIESALLFTGGTQGNLAALPTHCRRGDEVILGHLSHTLNFEVGGASALGGLIMKAVRNDANGRLNPGEVRAAMRPSDDHFARSGLICLWNTHNCSGATARGRGQ